MLTLKRKKRGKHDSEDESGSAEGESLLRPVGFAGGRVGGLRAGPLHEPHRRNTHVGHSGHASPPEVDFAARQQGNDTERTLHLEKVRRSAARWLASDDGCSAYTACVVAVINSLVKGNSFNPDRLPL